MNLRTIAFNNLRRRKARLVFLVAGLLIGVATVVTLLSRAVARAEIAHAVSPAELLDDAVMPAGHVVTKNQHVVGLPPDRDRFRVELQTPVVRLGRPDFDVRHEKNPLRK